MTAHAVDNLPAWLVNHADENAPISQEMLDHLQVFFDKEKDKIQAKYKIELILGERSLMNPVPGLLLVFSNNGYHCGGDEGIYFCVEEVEKNGQTAQCCTPVDPKFSNGNWIVCTGCKRTVQTKDLQGQVFARSTLTNWAKCVAYYFQVLQGNADIRMVLLPPKQFSLIAATEKETTKSRKGEEYLKHVDRTQTALYPLRNIIRDTSAGANLVKRFRAFLAS
jgi:hypothetical protein